MYKRETGLAAVSRIHSAQVYEHGEYAREQISLILVQLERLIGALILHNLDFEVSVCEFRLFCCQTK